MKLKFYKLRAIFMLYVTRFLAKVLVLEMPPLFSVTGLIRRGDQLLFLDLSYSKGLGLPGGIVHESETLEEALEREILEETGFETLNLRYFASVKSRYHGFPTVSVVFLVEVSGEMKRSEEGALVWMEPREAQGKLFYSDSEETLRRFLASKNVIQ